MDFVLQLIDFIRHPALLTELGYPVLALIIFLETGAMIFFLPGDSLLVTAGVYAATGKLSLLMLNLILIPSAVLGPMLSYFIGAKVGPVLFSKPRSRFFRPEHLQAAHNFYELHGGKAIIIARFMPLVRTFVPVVAGVAQMRYRDFAMYNITGGVSWVASMTLIGYVLGTRIPNLGSHIEKVIIVIVFLSILPGIIAWWRSRKSAA